ncbi:HMG-Y-related protein A [Sesamum angolense]|uniref:HMG-Y-related protein A n=1 Tax=Sesamum angolense TaxID=2727404 RepID=A0AAE1W0R1_9LAMI|nr:HMG-Y-related protein A [Sesamum angolense]
MIMEALDALKQTEGANKSAISKYMESKYGEMPAGHADLLSHHLNRMKDSGELLFIKNNYVKPGPDAPQKRGRGRPPKPKGTLPTGAIAALPGPRSSKEGSQCTTCPQETEASNWPAEGPEGDSSQKAKNESAASAE